MTRDDYLEIMHFPRLWQELGMFTDELAAGQVPLYAPGDEATAEHDRQAAMHWWLKYYPSKEVLLKLVRLSFADPEPMMAAYFRDEWICRHPLCDEDVRKLIAELAS